MVLKWWLVCSIVVVCSVLYRLLCCCCCPILCRRLTFWWFFLSRWFPPDRCSKMNDYKAPRDKMICLLNACKVIVRLLTEAATDAGEFDLVHRSTLQYYFLPLHSWYPLKCWLFFLFLGLFSSQGNRRRVPINFYPPWFTWCWKPTHQIYFPI